ncbi:MAG: MoxR family ATPase [Chloroflexota bacterium]|nr:MoxR family ATPase [Chloroflexota bacterium]
MISRPTEERIEHFHLLSRDIRTELGKVIVGQQAVVDNVLICLLAGGHALLEGVPGLGKTELVKTLGEVLDLRYGRVQFTPDLMPADITGTTVITEDQKDNRFFRFEPGPIFNNLVLADEINRATPKTQSALLEAMHERTVTVGNSLHDLPIPFFVMATQNPIEMEGTYPLPEAQLDRFFFKIIVEYPDAAELEEIVLRTTTDVVPEVRKVATTKDILALQVLVRQVPIASHVLRYAVRLVTATDPDSPEAPQITRNYVRYGASPRGAQTLVLGGKVRALFDERYNVSFDDIRAVAHQTLRHRLILNFEAEAEGITADTVIDELVMTISPDTEE